MRPDPMTVARVLQEVAQILIDTEPEGDWLTDQDGEEHFVLSIAKTKKAVAAAMRERAEELEASAH